MRKMIGLISILILVFGISCKKTILMADGTYISKRQEKRIFRKAWKASFGKMTKEEEKLLFDGVRISTDTLHH